MRIWSLHPEYLDRQGLVACWRESLLAQKVLAGQTVGYIRHPQLARFRVLDDPLAWGILQPARVNAPSVWRAGGRPRLRAARG